MQLFKDTFRFPLLLWLIAAIVGTCAVYYAEGKIGYAITDGLTSATAFTLTVMAALYIMRSYPTYVAAIAYAILIGCAAGIVSNSLAGLLFHLINDVPADNALYENAASARFLAHCIAACWAISFHVIKEKNNSLEEKINRIADVATLHKEAELFKLRQQIQPHFLYNSLNSINSLILINPSQAQLMIGKLSDFLRLSVKRDTHGVVLLSDELDYINTYLDIETLRFNDRLKVSITGSYQPHTTIPPFLVQPILENAIKYGLYGNTGEVLIPIHISDTDTLLQLRIENPVNDENMPTVGTGFGLEGIRRRLFLLFGRDDLLRTERENSTFITTIRIPQQDA